jgi:hypothetical protein
MLPVFLSGRVPELEHRELRWTHQQKIAWLDHFAKLGKGDEVMERAHSVGHSRV